ncbi:MAG TPA: hypothetical protein VIM12_03330 [Noviherbaspirillum sp.]|uniref:hypothetical protein n=1 Tax=Noviherbaspirillum sp. TaxID=1926288 RepID=UPI002F95E953
MGITKPFQPCHDAATLQGRFDLDGQALIRKIVNDVQGTAPQAIGKAIRSEIHRAALIGRCSGCLDLSLDASDLLSLASSDCQACLLIDAERSFVIDDSAF